MTQNSLFLLFVKLKKKWNRKFFCKEFCKKSWKKNKNTLNIRCLVDETIVPSTQWPKRIILKIVGFEMFVYLIAFLEHKHWWRVLNQNCKHFSIDMCQNFTILSFARVKENGFCYWDILIDSSQAKLCKIHEDFKENLQIISKN